MNIHDPTLSRTLAAIIQNVSAESQEDFIEDARRAPDMESFLRGLNKYKSVDNKLDG